MSYTTNLIYNKREQLKSQMDDFATFQWRGQDMGDKYGCFIINESKGSLKFYNGPGYSNKYAQSQFSSSVNTLIGIDFKQQTISMKVGMYGFTIEEYQQFLNDIGPYEVNYLTFGYEKNYSYLVKMAKMSDSPRHVIGINEKGQHVYYTELDLTGELLGDNCVRSNLPYEYSYNIDSGMGSCLVNNVDMKDNSLLDTPIMFDLPLKFKSSNPGDTTAKIELNAICNNTNNNTQIDPPLQETLFSVVLKNLTISDIKPQDMIEGEYILGPGWKTIPAIYKNNKGYINISDAKITSVNYKGSYSTIENNDDYTISKIGEDPNEQWITIDLSKPIKSATVNLNGDLECKLSIDQTTITDDNFAIGFDSMANTIKIRDKRVDYDDFTISFDINVGIYCDTIDDASADNYLQYGFYYNTSSYKYMFLQQQYDKAKPSSQVILANDELDPVVAVPENTIFTIVTENIFPENGTEGFKLKRYSKNSFGSQPYNIYQMMLRYDSETGLMYIQEGDNDTWHLLNFQTDNNTGEYLLSTQRVIKGKIPGVFSQPQLNTTDGKFELVVENIDLDILPIEVLDTAITTYARKNIV